MSTRTTIAAFAAAFATITFNVGLPHPGSAQDVNIALQPATETLRGVVESVDQRHDTLKLRLSPDRAEEFNVQDGLIFNSVRYGDLVELTVKKTSGTRTIVGLRRE